MLTSLITIGVQFVVNQHIGGLNQITTRLQGIQRDVNFLARDVTRLFLLFQGARLAGGFLMSLTRNAFELTNTLDQARVGIASMLATKTDTTVLDQLKEADAIIGVLRKDAREGVGDFEDYLKSFNVMLGPLLGAGLSMERILRMNRVAVAAGVLSARGNGAFVGGLDIAQAVQGSATDRTAQIVGPYLQMIGVSLAEFNKKTVDQRIELLERAFVKLEEGAAIFSQTLGVQIDSSRDLLNELIRSFAGPVFSAVNDFLTVLNDRIEANLEDLKKTADYLSRKVVGSAQVASPGTAISAGAGAAAGFGIFTAARMASIMGVTGAGATAAAWGSGTSVAASAMALLQLALANVAWVIGPVVVGVTAMVTAFQKGGPVVEVFKTTLDFLWNSIVDLGEALSDAIGGETMRQLGEVLIGLLAALALALGAIIKLAAFVITFVFELFDALISGMKMMAGAIVQVFGWALKQIMPQEGAPIEAFGKSMSDYGSNEFTSSIDNIGKAYNRLVSWGDRADNVDSMFQPSPGDPTYQGGGNPNATVENNTNINGPVSITIKVENMDDPYVVATNFDKLVERIRNFPTTARARGTAPRQR